MPDYIFEIIDLDELQYQTEYTNYLQAQKYEREEDGMGE